MLGKQTHRYKIFGKLGPGEIGDAHHNINTKLGCEVALKFNPEYCTKEHELDELSRHLAQVFTRANNTTAENVNQSHVSLSSLALKYCFPVRLFAIESEPTAFNF